jgi:nucleoside-diphosphate-sugar epimerase
MRIVFFGYGHLTQSLIAYFESSIEIDVGKFEIYIVTNQTVLIRRGVRVVTKSIFDKSYLDNSVLIIGYKNLDQIYDLHLRPDDFEKCKMIVLLSSVSVFGDSREPASDLVASAPLNKYGIEKNNLENYFKENSKETAVFFLRISNVYGYKGSPGIVSYILKQFALKEPIMINGEPNWVRNFVSADFLQLTLEKLIVNYDKFTEKHCYLNISSDWNLQISDLIESVKIILDWWPIVIYEPQENNQIHVSRILPSNKLNLLGLEPESFDKFENFVSRFKTIDSDKLIPYL